MTKPGLSGSRDRGLGDEHARYKRTRGGDDGGERGGKRLRREYDGDEYDREERGSRRRSVSSPDEARETRRRSRDRYQHRHFEDDHTSQLKSKSTNSSHRERREPSHPNRAAEHSPSTSSTRHHHHSHHHHHHHRHRHPSKNPSHTPNELPFGARPLVRSDLDAFKPLFAQYIEVQKNKDAAAMDEREIRGRWKSFIGKWNRGELAEGWYRAETLDSAREDGFGAAIQTHTTTEQEKRGINIDKSPSPAASLCGQSPSHTREDHSDNSESESDSYGPTLPQSSSTATTTKHGPDVPSLQDLSLRRETAAEEQQQRIADLRAERKHDRKQQRERLEELAPRAEPGTRERKLEKKREVGDKMRGFRERSPGGEVGEAELMGGGDGVAEYKRMRKEGERRRTEREVRREEEERAREAEREERRRVWRVREEGVLEGLRRIARERFG
ncbi:uncharacterized protein GGS22DRAFT_198051 [Annulohypoxylon maeteangense]|uniref:uncharacterized protein n=1 Tax=Annulohypoxylon maeteangense TaxID=1927788 RepID=UPI002007E829|nr:uncharacterized protein GGS22DRAFT_198051 [Annulohypoxylon maeteangense]KAI0888234.1 hypothetical protein GGS22DRAFT_198051 [Annulohypoxylon maeteangense]